MLVESLCVALLTLSAVLADFEVPDALVEAYTPQGFSVSIPDQEGIKLFAFHGKINEEMNGREGGTFSRDITKAKNGRWTFYDPITKLNVGDVIYYWTYVDYFDGRNKLGYPKDDQEFTVTELLPKPVKGKPAPKPTIAPAIPPRIDVDGNVCEVTPTTVNTKETCKGKLIFNSSFTPEGIARDWTIQRKYALDPDFEFVMYDDSETMKTENGRLVITPVLTDKIHGENYVGTSSGYDFGDRCTGVKGSPECYQRPEAWFIIPPVTSAQITTKGKFHFKYGRVEIRAKLPKGDWIYPELYLNSQNDDYGSYYQSGQIRIAFVSGNEQESKTLQGGAILGDSKAARKYAVKAVQRVSSWSDDFHVFTAIWKPDSIIVGVDDKVYANIFPPENGFASLRNSLTIKHADRWQSGSKTAPFDKEMYLTIGVGVGGQNFEDRSDGSKPWTNSQPVSQKDFYRARSDWLKTWGEHSKLEVDYIRVYAL
ncbi:beta-1,3-glucan-binding protein [Cylas formicarius]|uniref:beta-1,3-glucan-binding protein n=1 Tax=Cylas formicarius TaxID=197179 RepID=UPI0029584412|nr:beta-1,3-glucan-binding protein [Cylas formicarius]